MSMISQSLFVASHIFFTMHFYLSCLVGLNLRGGMVIKSRADFEKNLDLQWSNTFSAFLALSEDYVVNNRLQLQKSQFLIFID